MPLGIMEAQLRAHLKPLDSTVIFEEVLHSLTADVILSSTAQKKKSQEKKRRKEQNTKIFSPSKTAILVRIVKLIIIILYVLYAECDTTSSTQRLYVYQCKETSKSSSCESFSIFSQHLFIILPKKKISITIQKLCSIDRKNTLVTILSTQFNFIRNCIHIDYLTPHNI